LLTDGTLRLIPSLITPSLEIDKNNSQIVIGSPNAALDTITINQNVDNTSIDYSDILLGTDVTITNGWTALVDLDNSVSGFDVSVDIDDTTTFTGPSGWNGVIELPTLEQVTLNVIVTPTGTDTFSEVTAFRIGLVFHCL